ncbi:DUF4870 domain-containing protein [Patescibacteria group bacterium]
MEGQQPPQPQQSQQSSGGDAKVLGAICYIPVIGLIMYFVKKDDPFVLFHAKQGAVLTIIWIGLWILSGLFFWVFWPLYWVIGIVELVLGIMALIGLIKAAMGQMWKMPLIGDWAEKFGAAVPPGGSTPPSPPAASKQ